MKRFLYIGLPLALMTIVLCSCKQDDWMDWKAQNELWLEQNKITHQDDPYFHVLADSLQYIIVNSGNLTDARPDAESSVLITYRATLITGVEVDSDTQLSVQMSNIISGLAEGLKKMHRTGDFTFYIPQHLAYGKDGSGTEGNAYFIPPYSTLIYEVHLDDVYK